MNSPRLLRHICNQGPNATRVALCSLALIGSACRAPVVVAEPASAKPTKPPAEQSFPEPPPMDEPVAVPTAPLEDLKIEAKSQAQNENKTIVTYQGQVRLRSKNLDIDCEELVVNYEPLAGADEAAAPSKIIKLSADGQGMSTIILKRTAKYPKDVKAKCGQATYDFKAGKLALSNFPEVEYDSAKRSLRATARQTIITVHENGQLNAVGPSALR